MANPKKVICMVVFNTFENDSRVMKEAATFCREGFEVHVLALWKQGLAKTEDQNGVFVHRLQSISLDIRRLMGYKRLEQVKRLIYGEQRAAQENAGKSLSFSIPVKKMGVIRFVLITLKKMLSYASFYRAVERYLRHKKINPDVIHCHDLNTVYIGYMLFKKKHIKYVYDSHELYVYRNRPYIPYRLVCRIEEAFEKRIAQKAAAVITVSDSIARHLQSRYEIPLPHLIRNAPGRKVIPERNGLSLRKALNIDQEYTVLLYSGGITFGRGLNKVLESLVELKDIYFVIMGYGLESYKQRLDNFALQKNVSERVAFFGPVPSEAVTAFASSADIGIAPIENVCLSYYFCAPNKVFEYVQGGLPVVASNFPDLECIVEKNAIGVTCDISNPKSIAEAVLNVRNNYAYYRSNVQHIRDRYCWEKEEAKLTALYRSITGNPG